MKSLTIFTMLASLMLSPVVLAQPERGTDVEATATFQDFDNLSKGSKMIARSLMDAQTLPSDGTTQAWSLDEIAAARAETGWGNVFKQMQTEGLVEARNLGEVVSAHARSTNQPITESIAVEAGMSADVAAEESASEDAALTEAETPADVEGSFDRLSTGNQKIARSLMDAQTLPGNGSGEPWTLDQIAAVKGDTGWGNVFKQMQSEGLVEARNLGEVISQYQHNTLGVTAGTGTVATAAASTAGKSLPEQANGKATGKVDGGAATTTNDGSPAGIATAAGSANGNAYGLTKNTVSASDGVTSAGSATIAADAAGNNAGVNASGNGNAAVTAGSASAAGNSAASVSTAGGSANGQGYAYGRNK